MQPNRLQCQQEAIRVLIQYKLRSNPENAVGMLSMAKAIQVLASMTNEDRKVLSRLHQVQINVRIKGWCGFSHHELFVYSLAAEFSIMNKMQWAE